VFHLRVQTKEIYPILFFLGNDHINMDLNQSVGSCPSKRGKAWNGKLHYEGWVIIKAYDEVLLGQCNCFEGADGTC